MANSNLLNAKRAKQDEFYTQLSDIEKEMGAYLEYNPDVFKGKTILLPCDDPEWSNFTKYFVLHFQEFGIKKLISTSFNGGERGKILVLDGTSGGCVNVGDIEWNYLEGDGDFRSAEVTTLRDEADFVITNPPFSLFREFMAWVFEGNCKFSVLGNMNAVTYKEIFPLIKENRMWPGQEFNKSMNFAIPSEYFIQEGSEEVDSLGRNIVKVPAICWFTNITHGKRNEPLSLMTKADNERFNKTVTGNIYAYKEYDNYKAIEVPSVSAIPSDYKGIMGVPISFLTKYCPEQFEILGIDFEVKEGTLGFLKKEGYTGKVDRGYIDGRRKYSRILIRHIANGAPEG